MSRRTWAIVACSALGLAVGRGLLGDDRTPPPEAFIGPDEALSAHGCVVCHAPEYTAWTTTPHYRSLGIASSKQGRGLSKQLGFKRGVIKDPLCASCHITVVKFHGAEDSRYGVSCESCHGAAKSWAPIHSDQSTWPKEKRDERLRLSVEKGMLRPTNLHALTRNCYLCHFLVRRPNEGACATAESLANAILEDGWQHPLAGDGALRASTEGFELVAWSQGEVRHNFEHTPSGANRESDYRRCLYVVGKMLDVEFSVRGLAAATDRDGRFFRVLKERLVGKAGALAKLRALAAKLPKDDPVACEIARVEATIDEKQLKPGNTASLHAAADGVAHVASSLWNGKSEDELKRLESALEPIEPLLPERKSYIGTPSKGS